MSKAQEFEHYNRFIPIIDSKDECIIVVPTEILAQANMEIGDEFIAHSKNNKLIIKKLRRKGR